MFRFDLYFDAMIRVFFLSLKASCCEILLFCLNFESDWLESENNESDWLESKKIPCQKTKRQTSKKNLNDDDDGWLFFYEQLVSSSLKNNSMSMMMMVMTDDLVACIFNA